jgi:osmotically-inducible protein OsmY
MKKQNERNLISTSIKMLCLALPVAFAAGCASDSNRSTAAAANMNAPAQTFAADSESRAADHSVGHKIFWMLLADTGINYGLSASETNGVVALSGTSPDGNERQRVVNEMWKLEGVTQVTDVDGVNTPATLARNNVAAQ